MTHQRSLTHHYNKRKQIGCLNNKIQLWPKRPTITYPGQPVPRHPKLPPENPRLLVEVDVEPTFQFGDVLL